MIEPPFATRGEFMRQNGPSSDCEVSVVAVVAVVQEADEGRDAERARHQHHLVVGVAGQLAHLVQDRGGVAELVLGQAHLADEAVQVAHERDHDLAQARIRRPLHDGKSGLRHVFLTLDDHPFPPQRPWVAVERLVCPLTGAWNDRLIIE